MLPGIRRRHMVYLGLFAAVNLVTWHAWIRATKHGTQDTSQEDALTNAQKSQETPHRHKMQPDASFLEKYNAMEDARLQHYLAAEHHTIKAVIIYLANTATVKSLTKSLQLLNKNFNSQFRYPVVIFHEVDFLPMAETVRPATQSLPIFFQHVNLSVPEWFLRKFGQPPAQSCTGRNVGYRSMCRFQAKLVYEQRILRHFQYYWRLDDDSKITYRISFDVFDVLRSGGFSYGFVQSNIDDCAHNVFNVTADFMNSRRIRPTFFDKLKHNEVFFNNFEVSSLQFWHSQQYRDYIEYIDGLGGIYLHRWGDAPIKTLALSMFVPLRQIHRFTNIGYDHPINTDLVTDFLKDNSLISRLIDFFNWLMRSLSHLFEDD